MARSIWNGSLSFGLVNVPVGLYTATQDKSIRFNQLERGTSDRVRNKRVNERTGEEVDYSEIVKGYDLGQGHYVILTDEELEAAEPERSRTIEITDFVDQTEIDPMYYRSTYYLAPEGEGARRAYALLVRAMGEANRVGVATLVMRNKEYLVAVRPMDGVMALETMYFADEVREPGTELPNLPEKEDFNKRELDTAKLLIDSMGSEFDPLAYHDTHRARLEELIERKRQGEEIVVEEPAPKATKVVDLMEALQASVKAARGSRSGRTSDTSEGRPPGGSSRRPSGGKGTGKTSRTGSARGDTSRGGRSKEPASANGSASPRRATTKRAAGARRAS